MKPSDLAAYIDHTLLKKDATPADILKACAEAIQFNFKGLCIERQWLSMVAPKLKNTGVLLVTVISFPEGNASTDQKVAEAKEAREQGAQEIDMVLNRELLKQRDYTKVLTDIRSVVEAARPIPVKVILETSELNDSEKAIASALSMMAGAAFVKTSTGFSKSGATAEDVRLMRNVVGPSLGVKASGGVRSYADAVKMIEAGATRLGTSASIAIVEGASGQGTY